MLEQRPCRSAVAVFADGLHRVRPDRSRRAGRFLAAHRDRRHGRRAQRTVTMPEPQDKITMPSEPLEATMNKRLIAAAAATALGASAASAEPPTIPPEFGENGVHRN